MLQGTFETLTFGEVLRLLAASRKTGALRMDAGVVATWWLEDGVCRAAEGGDLVEPVTDERELLARMVDIGFVVARNAGGTFRFVADEKAPWESEVRLDLDSVLVAIDALLAQWREIEVVIPSLECRPVLCEELGANGIEVDAETWRLITQIDRRRTVRDLAHRTSRSVFELCRTLIDLVELGAVAITPEVVVAPPPGSSRRSSGAPGPGVPVGYVQPEEPYGPGVESPHPGPVPTASDDERKPGDRGALLRVFSALAELTPRASRPRFVVAAAAEANCWGHWLQRASRRADDASIPSTRRPALTERNTLGALLVSEGLLTETQLDAAETEQAETGKPLGRLLIEHGTISEVELVRTLSRQVGLEFVDLSDRVVDASVASLVSESLARRYQAIPISWEDGKLVVAMADPSNVFAVDDIRAIAGAEVRTVVATASQVLETIDAFYRIDGDVDAVVQAAADEQGDDSELSNITEVVEDAPIVKFVNMLITQATQDRASDIHVEPTETDLRIRFRIDGVLHEVMRSPRSIQAGVISRLKVMADINIAERRIPQDGRISMKVGGRGIDLRVATLPTVYGEKVVMRILDKGQALLRLEELGFLPQTLARFENCYRKPYGAILVCGPTGSGKSTTLYATLNQVNDPDRNIITVEDPVEYRLPGINQVQVHPKAGLTFASALRAILRSDPDIVLVGEIRDHETAIIAIEAALTGHLVLSTLHTNDAASTPLRLVEMGVEPFLVTSSLDCVVAQRLARRLCDKCKEPHEATEAELEAAGWPADELDDEWPTIFKAIGCPACGRTGYRGRFALHEVMPITEEIERLIIEQRSTEDIQKVAVMQGMLKLRNDGLRKVAQGQTSLEEIFRVVA